jgi:hypothetical protein
MTKPVLKMVIGFDHEVRVVLLDELGKPDKSLTGEIEPRLQVKRNEDWDESFILDFVGTYDAATGSCVFTQAQIGFAADVPPGRYLAQVKIGYNGGFLITEQFYLELGSPL